MDDEDGERKRIIGGPRTKNLSKKKRFRRRSEKLSENDRRCQAARWGIGAAYQSGYQSPNNTWDSSNPQTPARTESEFKLVGLVSSTRVDPPFPFNIQ